MKNILLCGLLVFIATLGYSQVKVQTNGFTKIGNTGTAPSQQLHVDGNSIVTNGRIGVNTTSPAYTVDARVPSGSATFNLQTGTASFARSEYRTDGTIWAQTATPNSFSNKFEFQFNDGSWRNALIVIDPQPAGGANVGIGRSFPTSKLDVAGDIAINGSVMLTSDKRLKKNVTKFKSGLSKVLALAPVTFKYDDVVTKNGSTKLHVGLIAQELQEIAPELVTTFVHKESDPETGEILIEDEYLQINDTGIKYLLVNAIKEQQLLIDEKEVKIQELEDRFTEMENLLSSLLNDSGEINSINLVNQKEPSLEQNIPNPFKGQSVIEYNIPSQFTTAKINVYNMNGQLVKTSAIQKVGNGKLVLNADTNLSGTFSYTLIVDGKVIDTKKMVVTK